MQFHYSFCSNLSDLSDRSAEYRLVLHNASQSAAKETVEDLAVLPVFNSVKMQQKIIKNIGEERLERSLLDGWNFCNKLLEILL